MSFQAIDRITVALDFDTTENSIIVGTLILQSRRIYFEYHSEFITRNLPISPFHLPLKSGPIATDLELFSGLPGVFNDSHP